MNDCHPPLELPDLGQISLPRRRGKLRKHFRDDERNVPWRPASNRSNQRRKPSFGLGQQQHCLAPFS